MEFGRYVVLSTAHIHCSTAEQLTTWSRLAPTEQPLQVAATHGGWWLPTTPLPDPDDPRLPDELRVVLAFGRDHGCDYVLLDCDGHRAEALAAFPW